MSNDTRFIYIADVYCPWCYAFGPVMKRVADEHPDIPVQVVGGNLVSSPMTLAEDAAQSPGLVDFWHEVERASGRSLSGAISAVETGRDVRLYSPGADEILAVLKSMAPGHELEQLLELEELFYAQGRDLFSEDVLGEIAARWSIDAGRFESALDQPAALRATEKNLETAARLMGEITSYPSVMLVRGGRIDAVSRGYVHYETVASRLGDAMRDLGIETGQGMFSRHKSGTLAGTLGRRVS